MNYKHMVAAEQLTPHCPPQYMRFTEILHLRYHTAKQGSYVFKKQDH